MKIIQKTVNSLDKFQSRHRYLNFGVNTVKKYSQDEGGKLAALITYYSFLSIFPLLLAFTTASQIFLNNYPALQERIVSSISYYLPVIGTELEKRIHGLHQSGWALVIALLVTLYGARGGADAFCYAMNRIWRVPKENQLGFPASYIRSFKLMAWGGVGLLFAAILSGFAAGITSSRFSSLISFLISFLVITGVFYYGLKIVVDYRSRHRTGILTTAITAAAGVQILLALGTYILTHQLKHLSSLYGAFAVLLGLVFWIYLQVQVVLYAAEIGSLKSR